eukprot:10596928-Alexandrium_andersonii.AAC.1
MPRGVGVALFLRPRVFEGLLVTPRALNTTVFWGPGALGHAQRRSNHLALTPKGVRATPF